MLSPGAALFHFGSSIDGSELVAAAAALSGSGCSGYAGGGVRGSFCFASRLVGGGACGLSGPSAVVQRCLHACTLVGLSRPGCVVAAEVVGRPEQRRACIQVVVTQLCRVRSAFRLVFWCRGTPPAVCASAMAMRVGERILVSGGVLETPPCQVWLSADRVLAGGRL